MSAKFFSDKRKGLRTIPADETEIVHLDEVIKLLSAATGGMGYENTLVWAKQSENGHDAQVEGCKLIIPFAKEMRRGFIVLENGSVFH